MAAAYPVHPSELGSLSKTLPLAVKVIALRLDQDIKLGAEIDRSQNDFKDEDVPEEEGVVIPPRPPRRIHNPDGTITDPEKDNKESQEQ